MKKNTSAKRNKPNANNKTVLSIVICFILTLTGIAQPVNNNCANATTITVGSACTNGTTAGATLEAGENSGATGQGCWATAPDNTVWYKFTTGAAGNYTASTDNGGNNDTQIKLLSGS